MNRKEIPQEAIDAVAQHINERDNKPTNIPIITIDGNTETPHYFEILPFDQIDNTDIKFFAIDGSYNYQQFYNGLSVGIYTAGYICYEHGKQLRLNDLDDPIILGRSYYPNHILITSEQDNNIEKFDFTSVYDELINLQIGKFHNSRNCINLNCISYVELENEDGEKFDKIKIDGRGIVSKYVNEKNI